MKSFWRSAAPSNSRRKVRSCEPLNAKLQISNRILFLEISKRPRIFENDFQLRTAYHALVIDDQTRARNGFG